MSDFSAKALLASAKAAAEQPSSDIRTELGGLARAEGYEIDYAAYGHIVDTYTREGRKVQVKFSKNGRILMLYIDGQPKPGSKREDVITAIGVHV